MTFIWYCIVGSYLMETVFMVIDIYKQVKQMWHMSAAGHIKHMALVQMAPLVYQGQWGQE